MAGAVRGPWIEFDFEFGENLRMTSPQNPERSFIWLFVKNDCADEAAAST